MAKRAKARDKDEDGHGVSAIRGNGFDPDAAKSFVERILNLHGNLDKIASERMAESKTVREDIDEVYKEAKDAGVRKKALRGQVSKKLLEAKIEGIREKLEDEDLTDFDNLSRALGGLADMPLGQSALAGKRAAKNGGAAATA